MTSHVKLSHGSIKGIEKNPRPSRMMQASTPIPPQGKWATRAPRAMATIADLRIPPPEYAPPPEYRPPPPSPMEQSILLLNPGAPAFIPSSGYEYKHFEVAPPLIPGMAEYPPVLAVSFHRSGCCPDGNFLTGIATQELRYVCTGVYNSPILTSSRPLDAWQHVTVAVQPTVYCQKYPTCQNQFSFC
jgi:hypothetical protein